MREGMHFHNLYVTFILVINSVLCEDALTTSSIPGQQVI